MADFRLYGFAIFMAGAVLTVIGSARNSSAVRSERNDMHLAFFDLDFARMRRLGKKMRKSLYSNPKSRWWAIAGMSLSIFGFLMLLAPIFISNK
jgi:hypothetical protein